MTNTLKVTEENVRDLISFLAGYRAALASSSVRTLDGVAWELLNEVGSEPEDPEPDATVEGILAKPNLVRPGFYLVLVPYAMKQVLIAEVLDRFGLDVKNMPDVSGDTYGDTDGDRNMEALITGCMVGEACWWEDHQNRDVYGMYLPIDREDAARIVTEWINEQSATN